MHGKVLTLEHFMKNDGVSGSKTSQSQIVSFGEKRHSKFVTLRLSEERRVNSAVIFHCSLHSSLLNNHIIGTFSPCSLVVCFVGTASVHVFAPSKTFSYSFKCSVGARLV